MGKITHFISLFILLCALCVCASAQLRIATYNVYNFFDRYDFPYTRDSQVQFGTAPKPANELWHLARVIRAIDADIIGLQEVENRNFLQEFNEAYLDTMGYNYIVLIEGNNSWNRGRGIDVAFLSRVPILSATTYQYRRFPMGDTHVSFSRDFLHIVCDIGGDQPLHLFNLHAPSKIGGEWAENRRQAEASGAAEILTELFSGNTDAWVVVLGDFNDEPDTPSLNIFTSIDAIPLRRVPARAHDGTQYTWYGMGESRFPPTNLDHILVSRSVARHLQTPVATIHLSRSAEEASDHRPVYITLQWDKHRK